MNKIKYALLFALASAFAQDAPPPAAPEQVAAPPPVAVPENPPASPPGPEKLAVIVTGASDTSVSKVLGSKLLAAASQSGKYAETADQHGADLVCVVSITEVFGIHSISARLIKTSDSSVAKSYSLDHPLKSPEDLDKVSGELAAQLFQQQPPAPPPAPPPAAPPAPVAAAAPECASKLNINEITSKIQSGFPASLKDCSATLAKNMALAASPFGKKTELKEPKAFMTECAIDGVKQKLPAGADEYVKPVESFVQNLLNAAVSGASLDVKKLSGAIGSMNVVALIDEIKTKAANDPCVVDEPYTQVAEAEGKKGGSDSENERDILSFGFRGGINFSHLYSKYNNINDSQKKTASGSYNSIMGWQLGFVWDIAPIDWLHIQPGLMYVKKGAEDDYGETITLHNVEIPLLLSLKFSVFRINAGPYFAVGIDGVLKHEPYFDIGMQYGLGFDIWKFYIGAFYDYGFSDVSSEKYFEHYNRTIGFNLGINL